MFLIIVLLMASFVFSTTLQAQPDDEFTCPVDRAFGRQVIDRVYQFDLLCQPVLLETIEIQPNSYVYIIVDLDNYGIVTGSDEAEFLLHFSMQRSWLYLDEMDVELRDSNGHIQDVLVSVSANDQFGVTITNRGARSAIFDLSLRPTAFVPAGQGFMPPLRRAISPYQVIAWDNK